MSKREDGLLSLGDIKERLGFPIDGVFIEHVLQIEKDGSDKRAMLYSEDTYKRICQGTIEHITNVLSGRTFEKPAPKTREPKEPKPPKAPKVTKPAPAPAAKNFDDDDDDDI